MSTSQFDSHFTVATFNRSFTVEIPFYALKAQHLGKDDIVLLQTEEIPFGFDSHNRKVMTLNVNLVTMLLRYWMKEQRKS